jgi:hypothetical protein
MPRQVIAQKNLLCREPFRHRAASYPAGAATEMRMFYRKNVFAWEQIVRLAAGAVLIGGGLIYLAGWLAYLVAAVGLYVALTGVFGYCPDRAQTRRQHLMPPTELIASARNGDAAAIASLLAVAQRHSPLRPGHLPHRRCR